MSLKHSNNYLLARIKLLELRNKRLENRAKELEEKLEHEKRLSFELKKRSLNVSIEAYTGYFKYKYNMLKSTDVWTTTERIFTYSRRSLFIARLLRYTALAIALIETSAVFLLFTSALAIIIPVTLACALLIFLTVTLIGDRQSRILMPMLAGKRIVFIFTSDSYKKRRSTYLEQTVNELADNGRYFVFVVSSSLKDGMFLASRSISKNAHILRETYYFKLMRTIRASDIDTKQIITVH